MSETGGIEKLIAHSLRDIWLRSGERWGRAGFGELLAGLNFAIGMEAEERVWGGRMTVEDCARFGVALYRLLGLVRFMQGSGGGVMGIELGLAKISREDFEACGLSDLLGGGDSGEAVERKAEPPGGVTGIPVAVKKERDNRGRVAIDVDSQGRGVPVSPTPNKPRRDPGRIMGEHEVLHTSSDPNQDAWKTHYTQYGKRIPESGGGGGVDLQFSAGGEGVASGGGDNFDVSEMVARGRKVNSGGEGVGEGDSDEVVEMRSGEGAGKQLFDMRKASMNNDIFLTGSGAKIIAPNMPTDELLKQEEVVPTSAPPPAGGH